VTLSLSNGALFAIESKFLEPYTPSSTKNRIQDKYFKDAKGRWKAIGLEGCQQLAEHLRTGKQAFRYVDSAQLLKHMLGLGASSTRWTLLYLWFDPDGEAAKEHGYEIERFESLLGRDRSRFRHLRYSELLRRLMSATAPADRHYTDYLRRRYFPNLH
jgi:hypothetical protein